MSHNHPPGALTIPQKEYGLPDNGDVQVDQIYRVPQGRLKPASRPPNKLTEEHLAQLKADISKFWLNPPWRRITSLLEKAGCSKAERNEARGQIIARYSLLQSSNLQTSSLDLNIVRPFFLLRLSIPFYSS